MKLLENYRLWLAMTIISLITIAWWIREADFLGLLFLPAGFFVVMVLIIVTFLLWVNENTKFNY